MQENTGEDFERLDFESKIEELKRIGRDERDKMLLIAAGKGHVKTVKAILDHGECNIKATDGNGYTALMLAAYYGHTEIAEEILPRLNTNEGIVGYELEIAANEGHAEIVKAILSRPVDIFKWDRRSDLLINTAKKGHAKVMKALLEANNKQGKKFFNIRSMDTKGNTALMWAARNGHVEVVKAILAHRGDDIKDKNTWEETALIWAVEGGHEKTVKALLAHEGCDINAIDAGGRTAGKLGGKTALMYAVEKGHVGIVKALLSHGGCNINVGCNIDGWGWQGSALMIAARKNNIEMVKEMLSNSQASDVNIERSLYCAWSEEMVETILDHVKNREIDIKSLLSNAQKQGKVVLVKGLLAHLDKDEKPRDVINDQDENRYEVLIDAVKKGNLEVIKALLDSKYHKDDKEYESYTSAALREANLRSKDIVEAILSSRKCGDSTIKYTLIRAIDLLIEDVKDKDTEKDTEKWLNASRETIKSILSYGKWDSDIIGEIKKLPSKQIEEILTFTDKDGRTALHYAVISGDKKFVQKLLNRGANIDELDNEGKTALHHAVIKGDLDIVKVMLPRGITGFLKRGAQIEAQDNEGMTALHHAAINGKPDIVKELLQRGAKIEAQDNKGMTALHHAVINGNPDIVKELLQRGAQIEAQDNKGMTALHHAVSENNKEAIQSLLDNGADLYAKDNQEKTPLDIANEGDNEETKKVLLAEMKKDLQRYKKILTELSKSTVLSPKLKTDIKQKLETDTTSETFSEVYIRATTLNGLRQRAYKEVIEVLVDQKEYEIPGGSIELTRSPHTKGHQQLNKFHKEVLKRKGETVIQRQAVSNKVPPQEGEN
ncbi:MAG: ankyrin repeat domain-containing protein, partial [Pseudomonadota bacterium]|nr:ankyrin repeat domain-containing protein [Pseudomonadota bacterium]